MGTWLSSPSDQFCMDHDNDVLSGFPASILFKMKEELGVPGGEHELRILVFYYCHVYTSLKANFE